MYSHHKFDNMGKDKGDALQFFVNGKKITERNPDPLLTLADYLRDRLGLRGTKLACNVGECGSCTIMLSYFDRDKKTIINKAIVSCLLPLCAVHGCAVVTVEGIGNTRTGLHEIQKRLVEAHGVQCGFCTPGMVMSMYCLLRSKKVTKENIEKALEGNLCRCTGYRPIVQSFQTFEGDDTCGLGAQCCRNNKSTNIDSNDAQGNLNTSASSAHDPSQEPIFPSELQVSDNLFYGNAEFIYEGSVWIHATSIDSVLEMKKRHPSAIICAGFTQTAFMLKSISRNTPSVVISLIGVTELAKIETSKNSILLGASLTVNETIEVLRSSAGADLGKCYGPEALNQLLKRFGSEQIRNMATLGGSVCSKNTANSDVVVGLIACDASISYMDKDGTKFIEKMLDWMREGRYIPPANATVLEIQIPLEVPDRYVFTGKQSCRRAFDRALVNVGFNVTVGPTSKKVKDAVLCYGGIGSTVITANRTSKAMIGREWDEDFLDDISQTLNTELKDYFIGTKEYIKVIAIGFWLKFFNFVNGKQNTSSKDICSTPCVSTPICGVQVYEDVSSDQNPDDPVGRPVPHVFTKNMATGEALYYSDQPKRSDEKFLAMVYSTRPHAKLIRINMSEALEMDGVFGYIDHRDIPGCNMLGGDKDDPVFAVDKINYTGQAICGILADDEKTAREAVKSVQVTYEDLPSILSISEAIANGSFFEEFDFDISRGDFGEAIKTAEHIIEGTTRMSSQEHFYMEPQCAIVVPSGEQNEYHVYTGTQSIMATHSDLSVILGIPKNRIIVHTKRTGGAFGGKDGRPTTGTVIAPAAIAAYKYNVPVRALLSRTDDFKITSKRHPYFAKYKASFTKDGRILAVRQEFYTNGGAVLEYSGWVTVYIMKTADGCYNIPNHYATSKVCKTNKPTPGAFRGFGMPQSLFACEDIIDNIADYLGVHPEHVRERNLLDPGHTNLTGFQVDDWKMKEYWQQLKDCVNVQAVRGEIKEFNQKNLWKKRGFAMIPIRFVLGLPFTSQNQGSALVMVYTDGSVMLAHGGIEMGQGLYTKMIQVASRELGIPADRIYTSESSSNTVPNPTCTQDSHGCDINGPAVIDACQKIMARLEPFMKANQSGTWNQWIAAAYDAKVSLTASGHSIIGDSGKRYDYKTKEGNNVRYFTYGVGCTQVEIDCLTGEHVVLKADHLMDIGRSLNPGIDIGQIEGGFIQGLGLFTVEDIQWSSDGQMLTTGPSTYKTPTVADIPREMNVYIAKGQEFKKCVYSAKGVGEPPLLLGASVYFAIKDAIKAARLENGLKGRFRLDSPATVERIRMACSDKLTKMVLGEMSDKYKPEWNQ